MVKKPAHAVCTHCGFVTLPKKTLQAANTQPNARLGTETSAGRSFEMARMAALICQRYDLSVGLHNPGMTKDVERISKIPMISEVASLLTENGVTNFDPKFQPGDRTFDIIIMNETLQTIRSKDRLASILKDVGPDGLCIGSTDLNDGSDISESKFLNSRFTGAMWSGKSLNICAGEADLFTDFRVPTIAVKNKYRRKRYVFFYKSSKIENAIRLYFSKTPHAPSERSQ
jgi:hypothetical protein